MRLLTGPAGSGKTSLILEQLRGALRAGDTGVRLLVPTATMAQHLQNRIAREGFVLRRGLIQTLSGFVETWAAGLPQVPDTVLYLIVEEAARRVNRPEFARVVHMPGFCASLARTMAEFSSAGCDSERLAGCLPDAPLAAAFLAVYREVDRELQRRGLAMRAHRLQTVAARIEAEGLGGIRTIWLDGFHALPDPELGVIESLTHHADVTITLAEPEPRLTAIGFQEERLRPARTTPAIALVKAPGIEREVEEIARRILEQAGTRPFREIGIVVRAPEIYVPLLRSTLERFGIPARFYFDSHLEEHAVIRFLTGAVDAMLQDWDHEATLAVLRLAPRFADWNALDRFDFAVRQQIPNSGLGALKGLLAADAGSEPLLHKLDSLATLEEWRAFALSPKEWAARLRTLRHLFRPARPAFGEGNPHEAALLYRSQAEVLDLFDEACDEAAAALDPSHEIALEEFWGAVKSCLRLKPLRLNDSRRNVVHVLSAHEARQWVLPIVFVCGMVEKQFPSFHKQDAFFPETARCALNGAGIRVRTAAEFEREELSLFQSAISRATMLVSLSYPEFDTRGDRNLPSIFLEDLLLDPQPSRTVRPRPRNILTPRPPAAIHAPALLQDIAQKTARLSATSIESYLQCAFQYFARKTLKLYRPPLRPEERLDFMTQGSIVHDVLKQWWMVGGDIEPLFEEVFARALEEKRIPEAYHTERLRNAMLDDLRAFTAGDQWPRANFTSSTEKEFSFALDGAVEISGKIDRLDIDAADRAYVIDYKYSGSQNTRSKLTNANLVQAPLYLMAAERCFHVKPSGMFYVGLKRGPVYVGWSDPPMMKGEALPENWLPETEERILQIVGELRAGRVEVGPSDPDHCRFCDFRDACRFSARDAAVLAEGA